MRKGKGSGSGSRKRRPTHKNAANQKETTAKTEEAGEANGSKCHDDTVDSGMNTQEMIDEEEAINQRSTAIIRVLIRGKILEQALCPYHPKSWDRMYDKWSDPCKRDPGFNVSRKVKRKVKCYGPLFMIAVEFCCWTWILIPASVGGSRAFDCDRPVLDPLCSTLDGSTRVCSFRSDQALV
ncbi:hypothetical protein VTN31DRAFT_6434 [Thermomyces dupontii]|uniref:uncharacterized protein n=1 Tax=Talaromyces thermophilus TaxID=28565 RepID=UPI00374497D4